MPRSLALVTSAALALTLLAPAQTLSLDKTGGGIGDAVIFRLQGPPTAMYALLFSLVEQVTPLPALGITLAISDEHDT